MGWTDVSPVAISLSGNNLSIGIASAAFAGVAAALVYAVSKRRARAGSQEAAQSVATKPVPEASVETATRCAHVEAKESLPSLIDSNMLPVVFCDAEGRVTKANEAFLELSGYSMEEISRGAVSRSALCPPDRVAECIRFHQTMRPERGSEWSETELLCKGGRRVPVIVTGALLPGENAGSVWMAIDVSGFRKTNAALWRRAEIEHHIATLSASLISLPCEEIDHAIEGGLSEFGRLFGAYGCATFLFDPDARELHKCYEWLSPEMSEREQELQLSSAIIHAQEKLRAGECIHAYRLLTPAAGSGGLRKPEMLCEIAVPLLSGGNLAGVLSIQCFRNADADSDEGISLLRMFAQTVANGVERLCAEQALHRSEQTRDAVWQASLDAIIIMDQQGMIAECNPAAEKIFGWHADELIGSSFVERMIPEALRGPYRAGLQQLFSSSAEEHSGTRTEVVAQRSNGTRFPCELSIIRMPQAGSAVLFIGTARDITERRQAEERLTASQAALQRAAEQTRAVLDSLPARVALFAPDGSIRATNRAWMASPLPEWMSPGNAADPTGPSPVLARILEVAAGRDEGFSVEYASRAEDGGKRWSRVTISAIGPHCRGAVAMHLDFTEHQLAIEALADSEERYRRVVHNIREAIFALSPSGRLLRVNPAVTAITGYAPEALIGRRFSEFLQSADLKSLRKLSRNILAGEEPGAFEIRVPHAEGEILELECTITPQYSGKVLTGLLGVARDVTERNKTQKHMRQVERMKSIGQLAAGVAHDFNNILAIQQGFATELSGLEHLPSSAREAVTEITAAGERAAMLTRKLLTVGGKQTMQPKVLDPVEFLAEMSPRIEQLLGDDVACTLQTVPGLPRVYLDPEMLDQVIVNLVSNSRDSMPDGGALVISLDDLEISDATARRNPEARPGQFVRITITDSGCGIPAKNLPHIFEPFFTTKHVARGAGLGLATVHGIVKQNEGWIEVQSRLHSGTSFRIYLPAAESAGSKGSPETDTRCLRTILLVEDETQLCKVIARDLRRRGYNVLAATSGAEALELWSENDGKIDLLLTDLMMPEGMNGRELAEQLLRVRPDLPVLYTSGYSTDILGSDLSLQPGRNFLPKPYEPAVLASAVKDCLGLS